MIRPTKDTFFVLNGTWALQKNRCVRICEQCFDDLPDKKEMRESGWDCDDWSSDEECSTDEEEDPILLHDAFGDAIHKSDVIACYDCLRDKGKIIDGQRLKIESLNKENQRLRSQLDELEKKSDWQQGYIKKLLHETGHPRDEYGGDLAGENKED